MYEPSVLNVPDTYITFEPRHWERWNNGWKEGEGLDKVECKGGPAMIEWR